MSGALPFESAARKRAATGTPGWFVTFADLMTLLMCFFVLMLSFSETDKQKYKQVAGSMQEAFGVQREVNAKEQPRGVSVIAREFSPGHTDSTVLNEVRQSTAKEFNRYPQLGKGNARGDDSNPARRAQAEAALRAAEKAETAARASEAKLRGALGTALTGGGIEIERSGQKIVIRIQEQASFDSGSDALKAGFAPIATKLAQILQDSAGDIVISGHTDDVPIRSARFRSNWELSSARAVSVAHALLGAAPIASSRVLIEGRADTRPLADNLSTVGRARNRRVEITLNHGADQDGGVLNTHGAGT